MPSLANDPFAANDPYSNPRATIDAVHAVVMPSRDHVDAVNPKAHLNSSGFNSGEMAQARKVLLPTVWAGSVPSGEHAPTHRTVDESEGGVVPEEVTGRDIWKAIQAPIQSTETNRSGELYAKVINQFAAGTNPRYDPDAPDKGRGHIFVWDVTRAMNAEVPHFAGGRELSLVQTMDWLRYEGMSRGWVKMGLGRAIEVASQGSPVLVLPKNMKIRYFAVLRPEGLSPDNKQPRVAAVGKNRGNSLTFMEAIGEMAVECFMHP